MCDNFISSLHIQKLGHKLEEIRIRALNNILFKLDHGIIHNNDFARCMELLKRLLQWFDFDTFSEEERVLALILRILNSDVGISVVKHIGTLAIIQDLKGIRLKVQRGYYSLADNIVEFVEKIHESPNVVPPLVSDLPLSYRSGQSEFEIYSERKQTEDTQLPKTSSNVTRSGYQSFKTTYTRHNEEIDTTATSIRGFEHKSVSATGIETGVVEKSSSNASIATLRNLVYKSVPHVTLSWQFLVKSDCHVLKSVEESLHSPPQPSVLLHSCEFFCNVMLQDFPAEVFLQRPAIVNLFYEMINTCPSTRITNAALTCLNKLSENLLIRIRFYSDPCTYNLKQGTYANTEQDTNNSDVRQHHTFNYNVDISQPVEEDAESEDTSMLQYNQITLPQYCIKTFLCVLTYISEKPQSFRDNNNKKKTQSGINTALQLVDKLVCLIITCIKPCIWNNQSDHTLSEISSQLVSVLEKLGDVLEQYRLMVVATDMEYFERMIQLHLLHSTSYLLVELVPVSKANAILPRSLKNSLASSLLDASFGRLYPAAHELLIQYANLFQGQHEVDSLTKYKDVLKVCKAMSKAVKILKYNSKCHVSEALQNIHDSLPSLEFHRNLSIINTFLKICVRNNAMITSDETLHKLITDILLCLLCHNTDDVRKETYSLCQKLIVNVLGLNHSKHIGDGEPGSQVCFFFRSEVFIEIVSHGLNSENIQIQTHAEDMLIHILKCKFVVSESVWRRVINSIIPAMPILQCFMDDSTPLGKSVMKMLDPDISSSLLISTLDVLKGNLRILFAKSIQLRNEAVSRLCWLLTTEQDANFKIPKIKSLQDCGLSNIFQIEYPIDLTRTKSSHQFYQASSLHQVLELLSSKIAEPAIRRSALTQISVMLEDHFLHQFFLEQSGLKLLLEILQNSLTESQYHNYPDSVIPVITILKNICLHNTVIRQELSVNANMIFNILRGLFLYSTDKRVQQDGAVLCCLLLFSEYVICNFSGRDVTGFSLPDIVVQKFYMPFKCHSHWKTSPHVQVDRFGLLMSDDWCKGTLRMHWNIEWFGGISELITWTQIPDITSLTTEQLTEFNIELRLTKADLLAIKASSVIHCCQKYLFDIQNATTHQTVLEAVRGLAGYIALWLLVTKSGMYNLDRSLISLPWNSAFSRFLSAPPANVEDQNLLVEILRFMTLMLMLFKHSGMSCWIIDILQDPTHYLPKLLHIENKIENKSVGMELLSLIAECSTLEQHLLDMGLFTISYKNEESNMKQGHKSWVHIIEIITENLKFSDTEQFYNLAYLDKLLSCLVQITSNLGWSDAHVSSADFHKSLSELIESLSELLTAFHYGKGSEAASSFMGLSITRNALLTMNHMLCEMQHSFKKNWESYWISDIVCSSTLFSLFSLWSCRDVVVRAATLQLLSGLASSARGATVIVENVQQKHGGVWETALMIVIDHTESSVVREGAATLLTNLCSHSTVCNSNQASLPLCHAPLSTNKDLSPMDTVLLLLKEYNFYEELNVLLACLYMDSTVNSDVIQEPRSKSVQIRSVPASARSYITTSSSSAVTTSTTESSVNVFTTASLIKAAANFVSNLVFLAPEQLPGILAEQGLIRSFFRCLCLPITNVENSREFLLYTDTLEMCSAVCALLTRSILVNAACRTIALHTRNCLHTLISLLNPVLYNINLPQFLYLRNQLWCEIFRLISALLSKQSGNISNPTQNSDREGYNVITTVLMECGHEAFISSLCESIESKTPVLQKSALQALTALLSLEVPLISKSDQVKYSYSIQSLLDGTKTPRTLYYDDVENKELIKDQKIYDSKVASTESTRKHTSSTLAETYRSVLISQENAKKKMKRNRTDSQSTIKSNMIGADLCRILLRLYEIQNLDTNKDTKKRFIVIGALSALLNVSDEAKKCALDEDLLSNVITQLRNLNMELSLHSAESLRKVSDKKKICPILKEIDCLFGLVNNFISGNDSAKTFASDAGLADLVHKFWLWFTMDRSMLGNILKMLSTFTTFCDEGCQSLTLTNPAPGSGPRKIPTNVSLLTALINLIIKEMELISRSHDINILQLSFHVLQNVCSVVECRAVLAKSNLFQCLNRLHPALTKRQRPWESIEQLWLDFLQIFTFYAEGQLCVAKSNDILEIIMTLSSNLKSSNKLSALAVLRNIAFHQTNRSRLLASVEFIQLLHTKLLTGHLDEKNIVISIIWALVANSQRSKIVIKCAGLDARIQDVVKQYEMQGIHDKSYQTMLYVLSMLKDG